MQTDSVMNGNRGNGLIRFEVKNGHFCWVCPEEIMFIISADHYVKSLIRNGKQTKWAIRHCTIKDILAILPIPNFIRLNRFYVLNSSQFSHIDEVSKIIYLQDRTSIPIDHRISPFIIGLLKN